MYNATIHNALIGSRIDDLRRAYNGQSPAYASSVRESSREDRKQRRGRNRAASLRLFARFAH